MKPAIDRSAPGRIEWLRMSDAAVSRVAVSDCGEALVPLAGIHHRIRLDDSAENAHCIGYSPQFDVRIGVARRLVAAAERLPEGHVLLIKESLRPLSRQTMSFERRVAKLLGEDGALAREDAIAIASEFIAPPWVAGHPTGGAVDLTLCDSEGREVDMGCGYDEDEIASGGRCISNCEGLNPIAAENRRIMFSVLDEQGFVNYPFEWWHWSYGDRYWAAVSGRPAAIYDAVCR